MFDIGFWELLMVAGMALLVLGPERLPGAIRSVSQTYKKLKAGINHFQQEVEQELDIQALKKSLKQAENTESLSPELQKLVKQINQPDSEINNKEKK